VSEEAGQEPNIWTYPEEAPVSQGGESINFFTFLVFQLLLILFG